MNANKIIVIIALIAIICIIGIESYIKITDNHYRLLNEVTINNIKYKALKCYHEKECFAATITLKELYQKKYLDTVFDSRTKELFNEESYVIIKNNKAAFILVK